MKKPAFQFYPGDWRKDQNLSRASLQAKGAMIEIMCLAFECDKRGVLATDGNPWTIDEIAHAIGGDKQVNISAIEELLKLNVLKKNKKNFIFSSRMVKDAKVLDARKKGGELGKDHGVKGKEFGKLGGRPVIKPPLNPPPSSSSSSSTSVEQLKLLGIPEAFFRMFRQSCGQQITDDELIVEIGKFRTRYPNVHANHAGALINTWISRIGEQKQAPDPKKNINSFV